MRTKIIISTFGPLHLIKSAEALTTYLDIRVIQGWIPGKYSKFLLGLVSRIVGRDLSKTIKKRMPVCLDGHNMPIALPEFYLWFNRYLLSNKTTSLALKAGKMYGLLSRRYIKDADIFHVRSGSGLGGAIEKAKNKGMKVLVDHSIAHPAFMDKQLREEYAKNTISFDMGLDSVFWQGVLEDCSKADCLLVNSTFVKDTFVQQGYDEKRIQVVYLGVREDFFQLKKDYSRTETLKILFTGSFGFRKGGEYLLKAMQELDRRNLKYEMTVVGSYESARTLINRYKPNHINFVGHIPQDDLKKYLAESDIYLFPSLCEGCASSAMEAMAAGLPVIATQESGLPIIHRENGLIVSSKDVGRIVDSILLLSSEKDFREHIGKNAARTIHSNYTWNNYAKEVFKIYTDLLES
jgi:glycosyltransferase involved in cell wall biosynthesis